MSRQITRISTSYFQYDPTGDMDPDWDKNDWGKSIKESEKEEKKEESGQGKVPPKM